MAFEEEKEKSIKEEIFDELEKIEAVVDLEAELVSTLEELQKERKNHRKTFGKLEDANEIIGCMKVEIEEFKKVTNDLES